MVGPSHTSESGALVRSARTDSHCPTSLTTAWEDSPARTGLETWTSTYSTSVICMPFAVTPSPPPTPSPPYSVMCCSQYQLSTTFTGDAFAEWLLNGVWGLVSPDPGVYMSVGRPVFKFDGYDYYLFYEEYWDTWYIGGDYTTNSHWMKTTAATSSGCPDGMANWDVWDGTQYLVASDVTFTCTASSPPVPSPTPPSPPPPSPPSPLVATGGACVSDVDCRSGLICKCPSSSSSRRRKLERGVSPSAPKHSTSKQQDSSRGQVSKQVAGKRQKMPAEPNQRQATMRWIRKPGPHGDKWVKTFDSGRRLFGAPSQCSGYCQPPGT